MSILFFASCITGCGTGSGHAPSTSVDTQPTIPDSPVPFAPSQISNMHSWFDAADTSTITTLSNRVTSWKDKKNSNVSFVQNTASKRPTMTANAINGHSAVQFDGTDDVLTAEIQDAVNATLTLTFVVKLNNFNGVIPFTFNTDHYGHGPDIYFLSNQVFWNTGDSGGNPFSNSVFPSTTTAHIFTVKNDQAHNQTDLYVDGQYVGQASYRNTSIETYPEPRFYMGNWVAGNYFINGFFAELIVYNKLLDDAERTQVESYLKAKWSVP